MLDSLLEELSWAFLTLLVTAGSPLMATDELWVTPVSPANDLLSTTSQRNEGQTRFSFTVPSEMSAFVGAEVVLIGQEDTTIDYQLQLSILANPSRRTDFAGSLGGGPVTVLTGQRTEIDVSAIIPQLHSGLDQVSVLQVRNDMIAQGQVQVTGGLNVGAGGIFSDGNVGIDGNVQIVGTVAIKNAAIPITSIADGVQLYAEDDVGGSGLSELKVRDEGGNISTLSPHNFSLIG